MNVFLISFYYSYIFIFLDSLVQRSICLERIRSRACTWRLLLASLALSASWWYFSKTLRDEIRFWMCKFINSPFRLFHTFRDPISSERSRVSSSSSRSCCGRSNFWEWNLLYLRIVNWNENFFRVSFGLACTIWQQNGYRRLKEVDSSVPI